MGRGDRPASEGQVLRNVDPSYEVAVVDEALAELDELIEYIKKDSPKNARSVYDAIATRLSALRTGPELHGRIDDLAQSAPPGSTARTSTVKNIAIYYAFPVAHGAQQIVLVLSIRRGQRLPLEAGEYTRRWLEEVSKVESPPEGRGPSAELDRAAQRGELPHGGHQPVARTGPGPLTFSLKRRGRRPSPPASRGRW